MLNKGFLFLYTFFRRLILPAILLLTLGAQFVHASGTEPYQHELRGKLKKGDTLVIKDEKFRNPAYDWNKIRHHSVQNNILLDLLPDSLAAIGKPFTCELDLKVEYWSQPDQEDPVVIEHVPLKISYDTAVGAVYQSRDIYSFKNAHRIKVTINNISCSDLEEVPGCFILTGQIFIERQYDLEEGSTIKPFVILEEAENTETQNEGGFTPMALTPPVPTTGTGQLKLSWTHTVGSEEIDLEWTTISSLSTMGALVEQWESGTAPVNLITLGQLFRNNATRITTEEQEYTISLVYSDDYLMFRMRTVTYPGGIRTEGNWSYLYKPTAGATDKPAIIKLPATWHEPNLNWQYSGTFAEGGKKKEVVSYMDGTLRSRQTVTVSNNNISSVAGASQVAVVQESVYDEFGRPVAALLPAPLKNQLNLKYYQGAYLNSASKAYDFKNVYGVLSGATAGCVNKPLPVNNASGAGMYYSVNNDFKGNPTELYHDYIPDAEGFPLAVSRYTTDKTGRLAVQGGVGAAFQPDPAVNVPHTTRYFYSKPGQWELDRVFGSDVGNASHYLRSTVIDPNGQASVSYVNASGKTIATALAGPAPDATTALSSLAPRTKITQPLIQPEDFVFDPVQLTMKGTTTYVTPIKDTVELVYDIQRLIYKYTQGLTICSNCYYALTISVYDNCGIEKYRTSSPVDIGSRTANCNLTTNKTDSVTVTLEPGEYYITYELALSPDVINDYTETYIAQNTNLRKQFDFILDQLKRSDFTGCFNECTTCLTSLGTQANFSTRILEKLTASGVNVTANAAALNTWISGLYSALLSNCQAIQSTCTEPPCERYRKAMLEDVSPGGQYAMFDGSGNPLEADINVLQMYFRDVFPVASPGSTEYEANKFVDNEGKTTSPNDAAFTVQKLVQYWKPVWADKFIVHHPEWCKLQFCENNSSYIGWDDKVKNRIQAAADIPAILPGYQYQQSVANWLLEADPFFKNTASPGYSYYTQMRNDLLTYSQTILNATAGGATMKSLTQYVDYMLYCADPSGLTNSSTQKDWNNCTPVASCRVTDREWQLYRDIYFEVKDKYYKQLRDAACSTYCPVGQPVAIPTPGCPPPGAFTLRLDSVGRARITYEGTALDRSVTVTLYYPPEYSSLTKQEVVTFNIGDVTKTFSIDPSIQLESVLVQNITCNGVSITPRTCYNGIGGTLSLPSGATQLSNNVFSVISGSTATTYTVVKGTSDVPDTTDCGGTVTRVYYNCLYVNYAGQANDIQFSNVWLVTCVSGGAAFMAGSVSENEEGISGVMPMALASSITCDDITVNDFTVVYNGYEQGYFYYDVYYNGPTLPEGMTVNLVITYPSLEEEGIAVAIDATFSTTSSNPVAQIISVASVSGVSEFYESSLSRWYVTCDYTTSCPEAYLSKTSRFPDYSTSMPNVNTLTGENALKVVNQVKTACESQADTWMEQLKPCLDAKGTPSGTITTLRNKLIEVCKLGGDIDHIFGSSTTIPGRATAENYTSFKQVVKTVLNLSTFDMECNPWLIEAPYPYKTKAQATETRISNTNADLCTRLATEKQKHLQESPGVSFYQYLLTKYGTAMNITEAELNMLLKSCNNCRYILEKDMKLPVFLDPSAKGCINAATFTAALGALNAEGWTGFSTTHANYEAVYTNYLNHLWGFTLSYSEYKAYEAKVNTNPATAGALCNRPVYSEVPVDPYNCLVDVITLAVNNGKREYDVYIEAEKQAFRRNYINTCGATRAAVKLEAHQQYYHYTLYYYDQAGNLARTVPPEGVSVLTEEWEFESVRTSRDGVQGACNYSGPAANTDKAVALQNLSTSLAGTSRSVEMWIYNPASSPAQVLAVTEDKKYLFNTALDGRYLHVEVQTLAQPEANVVDITASNHLTVDMQPLLPLKNWTHVVLVGAQPVANQPFDIYVNGVKCTVVANPPGGAPGWELGVGPNGVIYPESLAVLKQLRFYSRLLPAAEIAANAKEGCLNITGATPAHWARFNTPATNGETVLVPGSTVETQFSGHYPAHVIPTSYAYNSLNQAVQQVSPDGGLSKFWYDIVGRLTASQNAEQRTPVNGGSAARYSYTKYDVFGRIIEVGEKAGGTDLQPWLYKAMPLATVSGYHSSGTNTQVTKTWYDAVPTGISGINAVLGQSNLRKRVAVTANLDNGTTVDQASYYNYDISGNVKTLWQQLKGIADPRKIEYEYDLISGKVNVVAYQRGTATDQFFYQYKYDAENRLVEAKSGITASSDWRGISTVVNGKTDAIYRYYLHGPLARVELGDTKLQGTDYAYTLQGWLKGINGSYLDPAAEIGKDGANGVGKDVISYSLGYFRGDYKPVNATAPAFPLQYLGQTGDITGHGLFNGNISNTAMAFKTPAASLPVGYSYRYDQLNRLVKQRQHTLTAAMTDWGLAQSTIAYKEDADYDGNGNILKYVRNSAGGAVMDTLNYFYPRNAANRLNSNRLRHVKDYVTTAAILTDIETQADDNYLYDNIGNLIRDAKENITKIEWTVYGKIRKITKTGSSLEYAYDPSGNRVYKQETVGSTVNKTWYVRDAQGNVLGVYGNKSGDAQVYWKEQHLYGSSRLGMWLPDINLVGGTSSTPWNSLGKRRYELANHLGNVLVTISDAAKVDGFPVVENAQDYYPFGMRQPGRTYDRVSGGVYRYGFNGKENDNEVKGEGNQLDYGFRIYDSRIGKFLSTDPLFKSYPYYTPYQFAGNKPIWATDLDGLEERYFQLDIVVGTDNKIKSFSSYELEHLSSGWHMDQKLHGIDLYYKEEGPLGIGDQFNISISRELTDGSVVKENSTLFVPRKPSWWEFKEKSREREGGIVFTSSLKEDGNRGAASLNKYEPMARRPDSKPENIDILVDAVNLSKTNLGGVDAKWDIPNTLLEGIEQLKQQYDLFDVGTKTGGILEKVLPGTSSTNNPASSVNTPAPAMPRMVLQPCAGCQGGNAKRYIRQNGQGDSIVHSVGTPGHSNNDKHTDVKR